jgi:transglutaminase-like putative cysteine protease
MSSRSWSSLVCLQRANELSRRLAIVAIVLVSLAGAGVSLADAPPWMHALVSAQLPAHDEKTEAVLLYAETILNVQSSGKIKSTERRAYKILRPGGRDYGLIRATFDSETKITSIHGWCIPAQGKDYEVKDKEVVETALLGVMNGELATDIRTKLLQIPAAEPGNIVGYEIEHEDRPYVLEDEWAFQDTIPVREARYALQLPPGWEYKAAWLNHKPVQPTAGGANEWRWVINDVAAIRPEDRMPPWKGIAGRMVVTLLPAGGNSQKGFETWQEEGLWEAGLQRGRRDASPEIKQRVAQITSGSATPVAKMRAIAQFVQRDIRYVAIELGIGGWQAHPAADIFTLKYGDCKDKVTLMSSMLNEIGIESYYVSINTRRGAVTPKTPASMGLFNHEIIAVRLPDALNDPSLEAVLPHVKLGRLLFFDPTDELTPLGELSGDLQANYGLLVAPEGGELLQLPKLPPASNGIRRTAKLTLSPTGTLSGEVVDERVGDRAAEQREFLRTVNSDKERVKFIESLLSHSLSTYNLTKASVSDLPDTNKPFTYRYTFVAERYARPAGDLLLVRPRVLGSESSDLLETKEARNFPVEFSGPSLNSNAFEITLPAGYEVDDLPPPVDIDYSFASYHSKTEAAGNKLKYTRTLEIKELSVPMEKMDELKKFYRVIAGDERNTAVLKPSTAAASAK